MMTQDRKDKIIIHSMFIGVNAFMLLIAFFDGFSPASLGVTVGMFILLSIPWYFESRDHSKPPGKWELRFARIWIWTRKLVCYFMGVVFWAVAISIVLLPWLKTQTIDGKNIGFGILFMVMGAMMIKIGKKGKSSMRYRHEFDEFM